MLGNGVIGSSHWFQLSLSHFDVLYIFVLHWNSLKEIISMLEKLKPISLNDFYEPFYLWFLIRDSLITPNPAKRMVFLPWSICHVLGWSHYQRRTEIQEGHGVRGQAPGCIEMKNKDNKEEIQVLYCGLNINKKPPQNQEIQLYKPMPQKVRFSTFPPLHNRI